MRICGNHENEVPLIWTFAFNGAEYWCPYCGANYGVMGAGKEVDETPELNLKNKRYTLLSKEFLNAKSTQVCDSLLHEGEYIPPDELPEHIKRANQEAIDNWEYRQEV